MQKSDFTSKVDSCGFMLFYKKKPIGGARTMGTATRTSDGRRRSHQARKADLKEYHEQVDREINGLVAGQGQARYRKVIKEIDGETQTA